MRSTFLHGQHVGSLVLLYIIAYALLTLKQKQNIAYALLCVHYKPIILPYPGVSVLYILWLGSWCLREGAILVHYVQFGKEERNMMDENKKVSGKINIEEIKREIEISENRWEIVKLVFLL